MVTEPQQRGFILLLRAATTKQLDSSSSVVRVEEQELVFQWLDGNLAPMPLQHGRCKKGGILDIRNTIRVPNFDGADANWELASKVRGVCGFG